MTTKSSSKFRLLQNKQQLQNMNMKENCSSLKGQKSTSNHLVLRWTIAQMYFQTLKMEDQRIQNFGLPEVCKPQHYMRCSPQNTQLFIFYFLHSSSCLLFLSISSLCYCCVPWTSPSSSLVTNAIICRGKKKKNTEK